jgi:histidinol dehydrogenase/sulfopropanediol 3-dehydrogenase
VAYGDYVSGTNHTLPTMRSAKFMNGLWVGTFLKTLSIQMITAEGSDRLARHCAHFAGVEGLLAHQRSAELRMEGRT